MPAAGGDLVDLGAGIRTCRRLGGARVAQVLTRLESSLFRTRRRLYARWVGAPQRHRRRLSLKLSSRTSRYRLYERPIAFVKAHRLWIVSDHTSGTLLSRQSMATAILPCRMHDQSCHFEPPRAQSIARRTAAQIFGSFDWATLKRIKVDADPVTLNTSPGASTMSSTNAARATSAA